MLRKNRLFTPGPTPLLPAAQTAMASFAAHHRTADFKALFQRVLVDMKQFIGTENDVLTVPYGETCSLNDICAKLTPEVRAVFVQATESSTGARHDVEGIAKIV